MNIHIIGGGNLGIAIAVGISQHTKGNNITITRRNTESILFLEQQDIKVKSNNIDGIDSANLIILTIKPHQVAAVLDQILPYINSATIASAVSGLSIEEIQEKIGVTIPIVHIMPNIAIRFGESATCISYQDKDILEAKDVVDLFNQLGTVSIIDEN